MQRNLGRVTLGLLVFDIICIIISLATIYWIIVDTEDKKEFRGLWRKCIEDSSADRKCSDIEATADIKTVRAMLFLGLVLVCGAMACVGLKLDALKEKNALLYGAAGLLAHAGLLLMIGFAEYHVDVFKGRHNTDEDSTLHAAFAFCIIAWLVTWAGAGTTIAMIFMKD